MMSTRGELSSAYVNTVPARRLESVVRIDEEDQRSPGRDHRRLRVYFSSLTDAQAALLNEVLPELTSVMHAIKDEAWTHSERSIDHAFKLSASVIQRYNAEAWSHERWHELYLQQTPSLALGDAIERCAQTPWDAFDDLLVLSHRGSRYVPLFLFSAEGPPDPWWIAVLAALRREKWSDPWKLLAWVLTPQMLLQGRSPFEALRDNPQGVVSLAKSATREAEV